MKLEIIAEHVAKLDSALRILLEGEIAAGNTVASTGEWLYENVEILVCLNEEFKGRISSLPPSVKYEERQDQWVTDGTICDCWADVKVMRDGQVRSAIHVLRAIRSGKATNNVR